MDYLTKGGIQIPYEEIVSRKARKIRITILEDKVKVTVPAGVGKIHVKNFVDSKKDWIFKTWHEYQQLLENDLKVQYAEGERIPCCGKDYIIQMEIYNGANVSVKETDDNLLFFIPQEFPQNSWQQEIKFALKKWYLTKARGYLHKKVNHFAEIMDLQYSNVRIKEQKTRWGSCSSKKNINLNWRLVLAPTEIADYVIIHELAHLEYLNHSKNFWLCVEKYMPDYAKRKKWLKENGKTLFAIC